MLRRAVADACRDSLTGSPHVVSTTASRVPAASVGTCTDGWTRHIGRRARSRTTRRGHPSAATGARADQAELAGRLVWTQERISALECGAYGWPSIANTALLANALELSLGDLLGAPGYGVTGVPTAMPPLPFGGATGRRTIR